MDIPLLCVMKPESFEEEGGEVQEVKGFLKKTKSLFKRGKGMVKKAKQKALMKVGLKSYYRLFLLCEGKEGARTHIHDGYELEVAGPTMKKIAPVLLLTSKVAI